MSVLLDGFLKNLSQEYNDEGKSEKEIFCFFSNVMQFRGVTLQDTFHLGWSAWGFIFKQNNMDVCGKCFVTR